MIASTKKIREFLSLFSDPNLGLAILKKNKTCQFKLFNSFWLVRSLDLYKSDISSLAGIEIFRNLKKLNLEDNKIEDLSPLSHLRKLKELNIYDNDFKQINELANCKNLKKLYIYHPQVMDYKQLANITKLKTLYINHFETNKEDIQELQDYLPNCKIETIWAYVF